MNMNLIKLSLSGLMALTLSIGAQAAAPFTITGTIPQLPDSVKITLIDIENGQEGTKVAETTSKDGSFTLKGETRFPSMCNLNFSKYSTKHDDYVRIASTRLMAGDGDLALSSSVTFDSICNSYQPEPLIEVKGGKANESFVDYIAQIGAQELANKKLGYLGAHKYFETNANPDTVRKYDALKDASQAALTASRIAFIKANPATAAASWLAGEELMTQFVHDEQTLRDIAAAVSVNPDTARVNRTNRLLNFALRFPLGRSCPDFDVTTTDNRTLKFLPQLTPGKYTLIDFWASWCGPCRAAIPHVKELVEKYPDKFTAISVSLDQSEKAWRKALEEENMTWQQYWGSATDDQMAAIANAFFINTIPRLILLDDKGSVICSTNKPDAITAALAEHLGE